MKNFRTSQRRPRSSSPSFWLRRRGNPSSSCALATVGMIRKQDVPPGLLEFIPSLTSVMLMQSHRQNEVWSSWPSLLRSGTALVMKLHKPFSSCHLSCSRTNHGLLLGLNWLTVKIKDLGEVFLGFLSPLQSCIWFCVAESLTTISFENLLWARSCQVLCRHYLF